METDDVAGVPTPEDRSLQEIDDILFEVFSNGQRHAIGTRGDPDDVEPDEPLRLVPLHVLQLLARDNRHRRWLRHDEDELQGGEDDDEEFQEEDNDDEDEYASLEDDDMQVEQADLEGEDVDAGAAEASMRDGDIPEPTMEDVDVPEVAMVDVDTAYVDAMETL
jgi:hypothetical protein